MFNVASNLPPRAGTTNAWRDRRGKKFSVHRPEDPAVYFFWLAVIVHPDSWSWCAQSVITSSSGAHMRSTGTSPLYFLIARSQMAEPCNCGPNGDEADATAAVIFLPWTTINNHHIILLLLMLMLDVAVCLMCLMCLLMRLLAHAVDCCVDM